MLTETQAFLLNNAAYFILNHKPPGAGDALLKLATGQFDPNARTPAILALQDYWRDEMADQVVPLLASKDKWIPIYAARLLAWAGDSRAADTLVAAAKEKNILAAASLAYLPANLSAAAALKEALASDDQEFAKKLRQSLAQQTPARRAPGKSPS